MLVPNSLSFWQHAAFSKEGAGLQNKEENATPDFEDTLWLGVKLSEEQTKMKELEEGNVKVAQPVKKVTKWGNALPYHRTRHASEEKGCSGGGTRFEGERKAEQDLG